MLYDVCLPRAHEGCDRLKSLLCLFSVVPPSGFVLVLRWSKILRMFTGYLPISRWLPLPLAEENSSWILKCAEAADTLTK